MTNNKVKTRYYDAKSEDLPIVDGIWKKKVFDPPVSKLRVYSDGSFVTPIPNVEVKIKNVEGSFLLGVVHDLILDDHIVEEIQYRLNEGTNGKISISGFRK